MWESCTTPEVQATLIAARGECHGAGKPLAPAVPALKNIEYAAAHFLDTAMEAYVWQRSNKK